MPLTVARCSLGAALQAEHPFLGHRRALAAPNARDEAWQLRLLLPLLGWLALPCRRMIQTSDSNRGRLAYEECQILHLPHPPVPHLPQCCCSSLGTSAVGCSALLQAGRPGACCLHDCPRDQQKGCQMRWPGLG